MWSITYLAVSFLAISSARVVNRSPVERVYLANCGPPSRWTSSEVGYYANNAGYEEGELPTALYDFNRVVTWEGNTLTAPLSNGDVYTSKIDADAPSKPIFANVGTGTTNTGKFPCVLYIEQS
jgi:hypothetical protein